jgi:hypothetical protein
MSVVAVTEPDARRGAEQAGLSDSGIGSQHLVDQAVEAGNLATQPSDMAGNVAMDVATSIRFFSMAHCSIS